MSTVMNLTAPIGKHGLNPMKRITRALLALWLITFAVLGHALEEITYIHTDHLGSPVLATAQNGTMKWREDYQPFGTQMLNQDGDNSVGFTGHKDDKGLGITYMQGRWYHQEMGRFTATDPVGFVEGNPASFNRYAYANNNPYKFVDPDGNSPISILAKQIAKKGVKEGIEQFGEKQAKRLGRYMNESQRKEFANDLAEVIGSLDSSPLEVVIELIPVAGDLYGTAKFGKQVSNAYDKMQNLENKWVQKMFDSLPPDERKKFMDSMRNAGVRDARRDQEIISGSGLEGHHKLWVSKEPSQASDPRNIEFLTPDAHRDIHR